MIEKVKLTANILFSGIGCQERGFENSGLFDIEVDYDKNSKMYLLNIETVYHFKNGKVGEVRYLEGLLNVFTDFMKHNGYEMNEPYNFWEMQSTSFWKANSIPRLYTNFKIFVEGYKKIYSDKQDGIK